MFYRLDNMQYNTVSNLKYIICILLYFIVTLGFAHSIYAAEMPMLGDVLYHGSSNAGIEVFEPRKEHVRDVAEGEVVFATPSIKLASCYLFKWDDSWVNQFISIKDDGSYEVYMIISDHVRFQAEDSGGAIYLVPSKGFYCDSTKGLGVYEMISRDKVVPFTHIDFASALDAMRKFGVKVFFISSDKFKIFLKLNGIAKREFLRQSSI